ncbi:hypothetical protein NVV94_05295 [Pseudomonas sp. LS1212]|uniref:hypothetical protein n=1 Tax=Pseudomonas sp. LS1212 TaxID=2972478 RepID=UPI00215B8BA2|nr:hypothetical protein [Pseudomonas sp. LS1212]UVJ44999.1 hypothetical protein NVV94_05295 [Pseudomonas sp. LS1212]
MSTDIDIYEPGELQPYSPSPPLSPSADNWGNTDVDVLSPQEIAAHQGSGPIRLFGELMPAGATQQQVEQVLGEISGIYQGDMSRLGHPFKWSSAATSWFHQTAMQPRQEQKRHSYDLHDQASDPVANSFGNAMAKVGASQEFISNSLWWLGEATKRLGGSQGSAPAQGRATSSEDDLTDVEWAELHRRNERTKMDTEVVLRKRWGTSYEANIQVIQDYFNGLPARDQAHLTQISNVGVLLNTVQAMELLFNSAIGSGSLPTSGGAVANEIASIEHAMKHERKKYLADPQLQARYRTLINIRDGGN